MEKKTTITLLLPVHLVDYVASFLSECKSCATKPTITVTCLCGKSNAYCDECARSMMQCTDCKVSFCDACLEEKGHVCDACEHLFCTYCRKVDTCSRCNLQVCRRCYLPQEYDVICEICVQMHLEYTSHVMEQESLEREAFERRQREEYQREEYDLGEELSDLSELGE